MTRNEFIREAWLHGKEKYGVTQAEVKWWANFVLDELVDAILDNYELNITGLGLFEKKISMGRDRSDFKGGIVKEKPHERIKFTPSRILQKSCRSGMNSEQYHDWIEKTNALKRGAHIDGWELKGGYAEKLEE